MPGNSDLFMMEIRGFGYCDNCFMKLLMESYKCESFLHCEYCLWFDLNFWELNCA